MLCEHKHRKKAILRAYFAISSIRQTEKTSIKKKASMMGQGLYVALGDAVKELLFLRQVFWCFMSPSKVMPCFPVFKDNQGAVQLAQNPVTNSDSKHINYRTSPLSSRTCPPEGH